MKRKDSSVKARGEKNAQKAQAFGWKMPLVSQIKVINCITETKQVPEGRVAADGHVSHVSDVSHVVMAELLLCNFPGHLLGLFGWIMNPSWCEAPQVVV